MANVLTSSDANSATWERIKKHLEERIERHRRENDKGLSMEDTAKLRGRIAELKYLLDLDKPSSATIVDAG